jgi:hypothetical protein
LDNNGAITPLTQRITFIDLCRIVLGRRFQRLRIASVRQAKLVISCKVQVLAWNSKD